ncbi:uncharacterized protein LOC134696831 [Mytilus trossulus]|uniref:uncharacterized protein LOC134696831 n=1 Tax=Mytilus trossulus TaxID=6551 RepID=UPI003007562B
MMNLVCTVLLSMLIFKPGFIKGFKRLNTSFEDDSNKIENSTDLLNIRSIRAAGDQAAEGRCQVFNWGGKSTLHWYSCCNNCKSNNPSYTPSCDGETYQSASSTSYCNKCGVDKGTGNAAKFQNEFRCGDCDGQNKKNEHFALRG